MVSFGGSKREPVKLLQCLLNVTPFKLALSAKCTIHDIAVSLFLFQLLFYFVIYPHGAIGAIGAINGAIRKKNQHLLC
jgi:hypothetical protein